MFKALSDCSVRKCGPFSVMSKDILGCREKCSVKLQHAVHSLSTLATGLTSRSLELPCVQISNATTPTLARIPGLWDALDRRRPSLPLPWSFNSRQSLNCFALSLFHPLHFSHIPGRCMLGSLPPLPLNNHDFSTNTQSICCPSMLDQPQRPASDAPQTDHFEREGEHQAYLR